MGYLGHLEFWIMNIPNQPELHPRHADEVHSGICADVFDVKSFVFSCRLIIHRLPFIFGLETPIYNPVRVFICSKKKNHRRRLPMSLK